MRLTDQQQNILVALITHSDTDKMAESLCLSPKTVRWHLARLYALTGCRNRIELILWSLRQAETVLGEDFYVYAK